MYLQTAFIFLLIASTGTNACLTSSEEYAAEVVIPDYNFAKARGLGSFQNNIVIATSEYNERSLLTLVSESAIPEGLSVRLQRPTESREVTRPHTRIVSSSLRGTLKQPLDALYNGWIISCDASFCMFEKGDMRITAPRTSMDEGVTLDFEKVFPVCTSSCTGFCVNLTAGSQCIDLRTRQDLDALFRYANISTNARDAFTSYRIVGTQSIVLHELVPLTRENIDWEEAMRQELVVLDTLDVISLTREDIESIASLAQEGQAGQNYRIVYEKERDRWVYYDQTSTAVLSTDRDCREYASTQTITVRPTPLQPFYLIPLILGVAGVLLLGLLILIARLLTSRRHRVRSRKSLKSSRNMQQ